MADHNKLVQDPGSPVEMSRRTFMANATIVLGGLVGLSVAIPVIASTIPTSELLAGAKEWYPLDADEFKRFESSTDKPTKISFVHKLTDGYIESSNPEYVWGVKMTPADEAQMRAQRTDLFNSSSGAVPFAAISMGFTMFSPICPHLGCRYHWDDAVGKFMCPCHGSEFTKYGEHVAGPAARGLDPLPFEEKSGVAQITWVDYRSIVPARIIISYT